MKIIFLIPLFIVFGCETKTKDPVSKNPEIPKNNTQKIETIHRKYFVGDINNDKINDTAFVNFKWNTETNEIECGKNNCDITIAFNNSIPEISFGQSQGLFVKKTEDINHDKANEIIIFSRTHEGWWEYISVWSYKNNTWNAIGETKGFCTDNEDYNNRVIKENGHYYLIGENMWEEDESGDFKKVKVKL
jgi:hypothetical protein